MTRRRAAVAAALWLALPGAAAAVCAADGPAPSTPEVLAAEAAFLAAESTIARVAAYSVLLGTRDPALLDAALALGFAADDANVRAAALRCRFVKASGLRVRGLDFAAAKDRAPDLTERAAALLEAGVVYDFAFHHVDAAEGCASINGHYDDACRPALSASVSGLAVSFRNDRAQNGRFTLEADGRLLGEVSVWNGSGYDNMPAEAFLE